MSEKVNILVVEDNPEHALIIKRSLDKEPEYFVEIANNSHNCLKKLALTKFDIILLDFRLPDINGLKLLSLIKEKRYDIPVIMVTGQGDERIAVQAIKNGASDYITKSKDFVLTLPIIIKRTIERHRLRLIQIEQNTKIYQQNKKLVALNKIAATLNQSTGLKKLLSGILTDILEIFDTKSGCIYLYDEQKKALSLQTHTCEAASPPEAGLNRIRVNSSLAMKLVDNKKHTFTFDELIQASFNPGFQKQLVGKAIQIITIKFNDKLLGILLLQREKFTEAEYNLRESIAIQLGIGIENARLFDKVQRLKEFNENIVQGMEEGIIIEDENGVISFANPKMEEFLEYSKQELLGMSINQIISSSVLEKLQIEHYAIRKGKISTYETLLLAKDNTEIPAIVSARPLFEREQYKGILAVYTNISEIKQLEQQLIQSEKLSSMGQMISGVAHELSGPLSGILGFSEMLHGKTGDKEIRKYLSIINRESLKCMKILDNLLTFSRKHKPEFKYFQVNKAISNVLELMAYQFKVDGIDVTSDLEKNLPQTMGDNFQLQQVFHNLLNNARQSIVSAKVKGKLMIQTRSADNKILARISDNGIGVSPENLSRLFEPFFTTKTSDQGTGLGLSICYGIIKKHNGDIRIRSEPGQGAAFIIELPIIQQYTSQIIKKPPVKIVDEEIILSQKQILIVDDEPVIIELLSRILSAEGYLIDAADNGKTAIEKIKNNHYDLIISDIRMPDTDGKEIYRYLEQNKPGMTERIIFTTGDNSNDGTAEFFSKIKTPHLTKPFKLMNVKTLINDVFMNRSAPVTDHYNSANISSAVSTSLK